MNFKDTFFSQKLTITCRGRLIDFSKPRIMGIINLTPDSFYDGGRYSTEKDVLARVSEMIAQGADIIDVGACSTRPNSAQISSDTERSRLDFALRPIRREFPDTLLSIDTYRSEIAAYTIQEFGAGMINDIYAGRFDNRMFEVAGNLNVPVVIMHMLGTPETMQQNPVYGDIVKEIMAFFAERIAAAKLCGVKDIIIDPGFGFGKTIVDNFRLLRELNLFTLLGMPVMAGVSRKGMIYKTLEGKPGNALNGTTVLNTLALNNGTSILRVHDVKEAAEAIKLFTIYKDLKV